MKTVEEFNTWLDEQMVDADPRVCVVVISREVADMLRDEGVDPHRLKRGDYWLTVAESTHNEVNTGDSPIPVMPPPPRGRKQ